MFIGWIRKKSFLSDLELFSKETLIDKSLILKSYEENHSLCFGAYEENRLLCVITAYELDHRVIINNFSYTKNFSVDGRKRVLSILLNNLQEPKKSILMMSKKDEKDLLLSFGFKEFAAVTKATYEGSAVAFNFSNASAKAISGEHYMPIMMKLDAKAHYTKQYEYTKNALFKQSSLVLSTEVGYMHSYALEKSLIKISPWIMEDAAFSDAEKLLRGVLYHRGLKHIVAFFPTEVQEIANLYQSYKFILENSYTLLYKNEKPTINLEMVYGF